MTIPRATARNALKMANAKVARRHTYVLSQTECVTDRTVRPKIFDPRHLSVSPDEIETAGTSHNATTTILIARTISTAGDNEPVLNSIFEYIQNTKLYLFITRALCIV